MKKISKISIVIFIILISIGVWMQIKASKRHKNHFESFYSAEINSFINEVRIANHGVYLELSDGRKFIFYPYTNKVLNNNKIFNYTAQKGDKVVKRAYGDTLYLIKNNVELAYEFQKPNGTDLHK